MRFRAQSAIEFMATYGMVLLIIAIAISALFLLSSVPKTTFPNQCYIYGGLQCLDVAYINVSTGGSNVVVLLQDTQEGIINISGFTATVASIQSTSGYCVIKQLRQGGETYCIAGFPSNAITGSQYAGTLKISANYCAAGPGSLSTAYCPASSNYIFAGSYETEGTFNTTPLLPKQYAILVIKNGQTAPAAAPFQQMIYFNPSNTVYSRHESPDLGNIRFYSSNAPASSANELYSWCESGCTSGSSNAVFWIGLPNGIAANSNVIVNMTFQFVGTEYDGVYAGEAPQLSLSYAQYDNGANVFNTLYQNFASTLCPSGWSCSGTSANYLVNKGLTVSYGYVATTSGYFNYRSASSNNLLDAYTESASYSPKNKGGPSIGFTDLLDPYYMTMGLGYFFGFISSDVGNTGCNFNGGDGLYDTAGSDSGPCGNPSVVVGPGVWNVITLGAPAGCGECVQVNYVTWAGDSTSPSTTVGKVVIASQQDTGGKGNMPIHVQWIRIRTVPPNGFMPTVTFGNVI